MSTITVSYAKANQELVASFERYMKARVLSENTVRKYLDTCQRFIEQLGGAAAVEATRSDIRLFQAGLLNRGLEGNSVRLHIAALRSFYTFINRAGITPHNPMLLISSRKIERRLPRVLTLAEVKALIGAACDPFERAAVEVLYATGVRRSEFVNLRIEDIRWPIGNEPGSIRVKRGKGGKDRDVPFGKYATRAMREYLDLRGRPESGFLFEPPSRTGAVYRNGKEWYGRFYVDRVQKQISLGSLADLPTKEDAERKLAHIAGNFKGYHPVRARQYTTAGVAHLVKRLGHRAGIGHVYPHSLRRAIACHMLQSGADIRSIQELLGHARLSTTVLYTTLTAEDLKRVHQKFHPHENGGNNGGK